MALSLDREAYYRRVKRLYSNWQVRGGRPRGPGARGGLGSPLPPRNGGRRPSPFHPLPPPGWFPFPAPPLPFTSRLPSLKQRGGAGSGGGSSPPPSPLPPPSIVFQRLHNVVRPTVPSTCVAPCEGCTGRPLPRGAGTAAAAAVARA